MERIFQFLILAWLATASSVISGAFIELRPSWVAQRITVVSGTRLRVLPQTTSDEIARLPLGTVVLVLNQSAAKEKIGQIEDFWYRVKTDDRKNGWVFGGLTAPFSPERREDIYLRIAADRLKSENKNFSEEVELYNFLTRAALEIRSPFVASELELSRLLALSNSLRAIPFNKGRQQPYANWLAVHEREVVYSDPAGMWLVRLERFWE